MRHLAAGFLLLSLASAGAASTIAPKWRTGEAWVVKSIYYHAEAVTPFWSEPLFWRFEVKGEESLDGHPCLVLEVRGVAGAEEWSRLYLRTPGLEPLLREGHLRSHGEERILRHRYPGEGPVPVFPHMTIIPLALPAFPVAPPEAPETASSARYLVTEGARPEGGLSVAREVQQIVEVLAEESARPLLDTTAPVRPAGPLYRVTLTTPGEEIVQLWAEDLPWFVYSEDGHSRSWLWQVEAPSR